MADNDDLDFSIDLVAEGDGNNAFHLPNMPGQDFRRVLAETTSEKSPLYMSAKILEVHHGQMVYEEEECPATLILFEFLFQNRVPGRRYATAQVTLEFFDKGENKLRDPAVVKIAPERMHWLNKTTHERRTKLATSAGLSAGSSGVASGDAKVSWEMEQTKPLKFKATVTGTITRSKSNRPNSNAVTWTMSENTDEADGVPSFLQTALLLKRVKNGPFYANLRVHSTVDMKSAGMRALPVASDKDKRIDPVAFTPGTVQVRNNAVSGVTDADLESMEDIDLNKFFKVNLSEQDDLLSPDAAQATKVADTTDEEGTTESNSTTVKKSGFSLTIGKGEEGADEEDEEDEEDEKEEKEDPAPSKDGGDDDDATDDAPTATISYTRTEESATPTLAPTPMLERKLPLHQAHAPTALATQMSASASQSALVTDITATAIEAVRLAAQAATTAAEAAGKAAEAATAASRAAEAALVLVTKLNL